MTHELFIFLIGMPIISFSANFYQNAKRLQKCGISSVQKSINSRPKTGSKRPIAHIHKNFHNNDFLDGILSYTLAALLNLLITEIIKISAGRPRPDYFNRCFPSVNLTDSSAIHQKIDSLSPMNFACEVSSLEGGTSPYSTRFIKDGRKSFPSGHSSFSWMVFTFTSLYVWGKTKAFTKNFRHESYRFVSGFVFLIFPLFVSISRTQDYRHHWQDVLVGSIIGILSSYIAYRLYYPELNNDFCFYSNRQILWICHDSHNFNESSSSPEGMASTNLDTTILSEKDTHDFQNNWRLQREQLISVNY